MKKLFWFFVILWLFVPVIAYLDTVFIGVHPFSFYLMLCVVVIGLFTIGFVAGRMYPINE